MELPRSKCKGAPSWCPSQAPGVFYSTSKAEQQDAQGKVPRCATCTGVQLPLSPLRGPGEKHSILAMQEERPSVSSSNAFPFLCKENDFMFLIFLWITIFSSGIATLLFKYQHANYRALRCHPRSLGNFRKGERTTRGLPVTIFTLAVGLCFAFSGGCRDLTKEKENSSASKHSQAPLPSLLSCAKGRHSHITPGVRDGLQNTHTEIASTRAGAPERMHWVLMPDTLSEITASLKTKVKQTTQEYSKASHVS